MGHPLRWYEPGVVYEVTTRTIREQYLLRPCEESRELILGIIGRALVLFPLVRLYAFTFLSNHVHLLLSADDGESIPKFMGYVNGNVARELGRLRDAPGKMWGRRIRPIPILDDDALLDRFRYVVAQGCKEGLVDSPRAWPGASAVPGLLGDMVMRGTWRDRDGLRRARRRRKEVDPSEFDTEYEIRLSPLPVWAELPADDLRRRHEALVADIERTTRDENRRLGRRPLGVAAVLAQDPFGRPAEPASSEAPQCHASTEEAREDYRNAYRRFVDAFRAASAAFRRSRRARPAATFPPYAFPCAPPFTGLARVADTGAESRDAARGDVAG